uniref:zinc finger protein 831 n=1 Tax=Jaculus jaculus TaxID=51337 RepID=UPI001E1B46ED|nr:zinc finger protein 831 [Jaculus jaculus]
MEAPESTCPAPSARDQPAPALGHPGVPNGQASPQLTLSPVILPPEQGLPPTVFLKALPIPLYHTVPPGGLQPRAPLVAGSLDGSAVPFILSPLLQPEGPGPTQVGKPAAPALTVNIVGTLPVLSPGLGSTLGNPGKVRNAGKYLCPHCGRDCLKPSVLEKHIRSHTGERPFPCSICGVAFKTQSNLYKHRRTQTHLNNSRLSLESEGGGSSLPEEGDRPGESCSADGRGDEAEPESALSPGAHPPLAAKALDMKTEAASCAGSTLAHREVPGAANHLPSPGLPLASPQSRWKLPESKPCSLQRQQEVCSEKPWEAKASEGRLRKCESTDSGYLSRSDSAEQPLAASSPLHSLSEHSTESEGEGGPGPRSGDTKAELATPGTSLELEKKRLEERITRLISHNQAVVDDPHLDHVRPRKTGLSKQGSIDLPMPYTYKDSFHFDIRALEPSRRRAALSPACSTFTPVDKSRPLFFHSVPTQLSTTVECVPITRSNSLPFIEGPKMWPEPRDLQDTCPRMRKPLSPRLTPARPGCRSGLTLADIPTGHPRALVRQAAVEDLPCTPPGDTSAPAEDLDGKTARAAVGTVKGRGSKKNCQRKMRMFSQEKWQVYGNETFKRIYQKMKTSHQGGQKARAELDLPPQEEAIGVKGASLPYDSRTSVLGDSPVKAKPGFWESQPVPEGALEAKSPQKMRAMAKPEGSDQPRVAKTELSPTLSHRASPCLGSRSPGRLDLEYQLPPAPGSIPREALETPRQPSPDLQVEVDISGDGSTKDICSRAQMMLRRPSGGSGEPTLAGDKLPSERKKLKVEGLDPQEQPGPLGTETSGSSTQAASLPSQQQDGDLGEMPGGSREHARKGVAPPVSSGISSTASAAAPAESGNKESLRPPSASVPRHHPTQPQTPSVLAALTDRTFAPKYLLRLPQGETSSPPATPGPGQGRDSLCTRVSPGSGPGTPIPSSGPAPSETCSTPEDPGWSRPEDGRDEVPSEGRTDTSVPVAGSSSTSAKGGTWEIASMLPTCTCDAHRAQDMGGETHSICHLGTGSPTGARTCAGLLNARSPAGKLGVPPKNAPKGMPSESTAGDPSSCPFQACYFLKALPRPQRVPEPPLSPHLGSPGSGRGPSSFPSLKAEPQLTWCCLSRSLPLPTEQEKATSGHWSLPSPGGSLWDERRDLPRQSCGARSGAGACGGGAEPTPECQMSGEPAQTGFWKVLCKHIGQLPALLRDSPSDEATRPSVRPTEEERAMPQEGEATSWEQQAEVEASGKEFLVLGHENPEIPQGAPGTLISTYNSGTVDETAGHADSQRDLETPVKLKTGAWSTAYGSDLCAQCHVTTQRDVGVLTEYLSYVSARRGSVGCKPWKNREGVQVAPCGQRRVCSAAPGAASALDIHPSPQPHRQAAAREQRRAAAPRRSRALQAAQTRRSPPRDPRSGL